MTTSPMLPAADSTTTVCPSSPIMSAAAVEEDATTDESPQQCRRCSFLFTDTFHLANAAFLSGIGGKATAVSNNASESNSGNIFHQNQVRRSSLPTLSTAFLNASMMMSSTNVAANGGTITNSTNSPPFIRLSPFFVASSTEGSGQHSRGENSLELEALTAVHQFAIAVESIAVSEMLPRTPDLIFVNLTTLDGQPYCLELTAKGWRITSLRTDCMQGDFTQMDTFTRYYDSLHDLMDTISPGYKVRFAEDFGKHFQGLVKRMHDNDNNQNEHECRHSADCSSGQMSDCECAEEAEHYIANNCKICHNKRLSDEDGNGRNVAEHNDDVSVSSPLTNGNSFLCQN